MIGLFGIIQYIIYFAKLKRQKNVNIKKFIPEILILVLVVLSFISSILSENTYLSFFGGSYRKEGLIVYLMYIGFILSASIMKNNKYKNIIFNTIIITGLIVTILPFFTSNFTYKEFSNVFHQFNHYGYYLMINLMLSSLMIINNDKLFKNIFYLLAYIFFSYLLIKNDTFGSFLAVSITFFFLFIYFMVKKFERKKIIFLILVFIITSVCVSHFDIKIGETVYLESTKDLVGQNINTLSSDIKSILSNDDSKKIDRAGTGRGRLWKHAFNYTLQHPWFGGGMESLNQFSRNFGNDRPHNIILQISSFIGIPGAIVYIIFILYLAITNIKLISKNKNNVIIYFTAMCYFISSMFGNSMYYTSPYFMILLGLLIGLRRLEMIKKY